jgi:hypothetical protein
MEKPIRFLKPYRFAKPVQKRFVNYVNLRAFIIPSKKSTNMKTYCMRCIKKNMGKPIRFLKPYRFTELEIV